MNINWNVLTRKTHYWASLAILLPALVIFGTGIVLQLKKDVAWIQPATQRGAQLPPQISFDEVLAAARSVKEAEIEDWSDVDRLDVRPNRGMLKIRSNNRWEIQIDTTSADVLQVAYRRSDLIETIHDGSWFHDSVKLWLFFPTAIILFFMWLTGVYLFVVPYIARKRKRQRLARKANAT
ncbi:MAG: PepSY domain-containing protein [Pseudohongiellaceae bacterium]